MHITIVLAQSYCFETKRTNIIFTQKLYYIKKTLALLGSVVILITSCTDVLDKKVNTETAKEDIKKIKEKYKDDYTAEDYEAIANQLVGEVFKKALSGDKIDFKEIKADKTYREILDKQKNKRLAYEKALQEYEYQLAAVKKKISIKITEKTVYDKDGFGFSKVLQIKQRIENNTDKTIVGVLGNLNITDMFDQHVVTFAIEHTNPINSKEVAEKVIQYDQINYDRDLEKYSYGDIDKFKAEWVPEKILYADGSSDVLPVIPVKD